MWSAEKESLSVPATEGAKAVKLVLGLDSFCDHLDSEGTPEPKNGAHHLSAASVPRLHCDTPIELDLRPGNAGEIIERRVSGAEVVDG